VDEFVACNARHGPNDQAFNVVHRPLKERPSAGFMVASPQALKRQEDDSVAPKHERLTGRKQPVCEPNADKEVLGWQCWSPSALPLGCSREQGPPVADQIKSHKPTRSFKPYFKICSPNVQNAVHSVHGFHLRNFGEHGQFGKSVGVSGWWISR